MVTQFGSIPKMPFNIQVGKWSCVCLQFWTQPRALPFMHRRSFRLRHGNQIRNALKLWTTAPLYILDMDSYMLLFLHYLNTKLRIQISTEYIYIYRYRYVYHMCAFLLRRRSRTMTLVWCRSPLCHLDLPGFVETNGWIVETFHRIFIQVSVPKYLENIWETSWKHLFMTPSGYLT